MFGLFMSPVTIIISVVRGLSTTKQMLKEFKIVYLQINTNYKLVPT